MLFSAALNASQNEHEAEMERRRHEPKIQGSSASHLGSPRHMREPSKRPQKPFKEMTLAEYQRYSNQVDSE